MLRRLSTVGLNRFRPLPGCPIRPATVSATRRIDGKRLLSSASTTTATSDIGSTTTTTHFGFEQVQVAEKEGKVRQVFDNVADSYDVMNDFMSAGIHRLWKDYLLEASCVEPMAKAVRRQSQQQQSSTAAGVVAADDGCSLRILDVAGGTGDVAFRFVEAADCFERAKSSGRDPISITVTDINLEMLRVGERRARERFGHAILDETQALQFVPGNAQDLHNFNDNTFDLYTISFGLRNVTNINLALREAFRVLKPGGRFMCLEFSQVPNPILRQVYDLYSFNVIPALGQAVANDRASYQYLVESIRRFPNQQDLLTRMEKEAGFDSTRYTNLSCGIVALHEGWKPL
jgi:ubiquinone/menaquinone biosynthesis methyltransferase